MARISRSITATKFAFGLGLCLLAGAQATAEPQIEIIERTYTVNATTAGGLVRQMSTRGPIGFWAYTRGRVAWNRHCDVKVRVRYHMPKHGNPEKLDPALRQKWEAMLAAMRRHEEKHGQHSINAGREIEQAGCRGGMAILNKWAREDKALDARTRHGRTEGVYLN